MIWLRMCLHFTKRTVNRFAHPPIHETQNIDSFTLSFYSFSFCSAYVGALFSCATDFNPSFTKQKAKALLSTTTTVFFHTHTHTDTNAYYKNQSCAFRVRYLMYVPYIVLARHLNMHFYFKLTHFQQTTRITLNIVTTRIEIH